MRPTNQDAESKALARSSDEELVGDNLKPNSDDRGLDFLSKDEVEVPGASPTANARIAVSAGLPVAPEHRLPKIIPFETLARCGEEIWIENNGQIYRLRKTKQGKLILTK